MFYTALLPDFSLPAAWFIACEKYTLEAGRNRRTSERSCSVQT